MMPTLMACSVRCAAGETKKPKKPPEVLAATPENEAKKKEFKAKIDAVLSQLNA